MIAFNRSNIGKYLLHLNILYLHCNLSMLYINIAMKRCVDDVIIEHTDNRTSIYFIYIYLFNYNNRSIIIQNINYNLIYTVFILFSFAKKINFILIVIYNI